MLQFMQVLRQFQLMANLNDEQSIRYHDMIQLTIDEVEKKTKPGVVEEKKNHRLLIQLAGATAYYRYMVMTNMASTNISALDLSVSVDYSKQIMAAKRLRDEFSILAKDLLDDEHFIFHLIS